MPLEFRCHVEDGDVKNTDALRAYRAKLVEWHAWLEGDDPHSIWRQIIALCWADASFRIVNESRRIAARRAGPWCAQNGLLVRLLDRGYVSEMALGIRRVTGPPHAKDDKQVVSLVRLLDDLVASRHLITRENFVCWNGLSFDTKRAEQLYWAEDKGDVSGVEVSSQELGGPEDALSTELRHESFDELVDGSPDRADRNQTIGAEKLAGWKTALTRSADEIRVYANKFIAHAAAPESIATLQAQQPGLTINKIEAALRPIVELADRLSSLLFGIGHPTPLAVPQYDHLEGLDKPWVPESAMDELRQRWKDYDEMVQGWVA